MIYDIPVLNQTFEPISAIEIKQEEKPKEPKLYTIKQGDNLTKIAEAHSVDLSRLWSANPELANPDLIEPDKPLKIPENDEVLPERPMPVTVETSGYPITQSAPSGRLSVGGLNGTLGYAIPYGNCVDEPGVNSPRNGTNPIAWPILTYEPYIGATALWTYNHTGVVVGLWNNGDIEVRHQNYRGGQTRFPRSAFRGYR